MCYSLLFSLPPLSPLNSLSLPLPSLVLKSFLRHIERRRERGQREELLSIFHVHISVTFDLICN